MSLARELFAAARHITQVKNLRIRYVIGRLKSMKARTAQQDEQLALAENYLEKREAALKSAASLMVR